MLKHLLFGCVIIFILSSCSNGKQDDVQWSLKNCDRDNLICPDGSIVMRVPPDCEFERCPEQVYDKCSDPKREYWKHDTRECPYITLKCDIGKNKFDDECGCGCE